jgi:hypothetical protein
MKDISFKAIWEELVTYMYSKVKRATWSDKRLIDQLPTH